MLALAASCKKEDVTDYGPIDKKIIEDYLTAHNDTIAQSTASGLYYIIHIPGGNNHPVLNSKVSVNSKGYLTDGTLFDSSYPSGMPFTSYLGNLIAVWQEGLQLIGSGGKIRLFIPSKLGYGAYATGSIPANSVLIFDIELVGIYK